jgi:hypothetical protein
MAAFAYRKLTDYESSYDVVYRYRTIGTVERNLGPTGWYAELDDGRRGEGRTRGEAVKDALAKVEAK